MVPLEICSLCYGAAEIICISIACRTHGFNRGVFTIGAVLAMMGLLYSLVAFG